MNRLLTAEGFKPAGLITGEWPPAAMGMPVGQFFLVGLSDIQNLE